ncbi:hypothetical protein [Streptosporangium sp. NPDC049046]|uniref:hypothetical protein n=1 Tax=Streptosporangium sp. NPDC049046 TaxID=3155031 RepID=UPI003415027E
MAVATHGAATLKTDTRRKGEVASTMEQVSLETGEMKKITGDANAVPRSLCAGEGIGFVIGERIKLKGNEPIRHAVEKILAYEYRIPAELPESAKAYRRFREKYPQQGSPR